MKRFDALTVILAFLLIACTLATSTQAMDDSEYREWEEAVARETALLKQQLPAAERGEAQAMKTIIGLATGEYIRTAEGGEWLGEIYLDLLVTHPEEFLKALAESGETPMKIVVQELLHPVNDKYSNLELKAAVEQAKKNGVAAPFLEELLDFYSK